MEKIKLLLIAPSFYPVHGGAGLRFFRYLSQFNDFNVETTVICGTPKLKKFTQEDSQSDWVHLSDGQKVSEVIVDGAIIIKFKLPEKSTKKRTKILLSQAIKFCKQCDVKPDIVHVIAPLPYGAVKELRFLKRLNIDLVYSHTIAREYSSNQFLAGWQKWKVKQVNKLYNCIIVQSLALQETVLETNPKSVTHVIPNGVDISKFSPVKDKQEKIQIRKLLNLPTDMQLITLVGAVHPRKGTDLLIEAWSKLVETHQDLHVLIIGPRYDQSRKELIDFKKKMEHLIQQSSMKENVHFLGQVNNVDEYLKATDVFVFPSSREGMPNAVLEAMSTGLPVVLTPFIGLSSEMGRKDNEYILVKRTSSDLASNIASILKNNTIQRELSQKARHWVVNNMSVSSCVKSHVEVYKELSIHQ